EDERVSSVALELSEEVGEVVRRVVHPVEPGERGADGVLEGVRVEVAEDEVVGVACAGRVRRQPREQALGGEGGREVAVALDGGGPTATARALALEVVGYRREDTATHLREGLC